MDQLDGVSTFAGPIPKYPYQHIDNRNKAMNRIRPKIWFTSGVFFGRVSSMDLPAF